MVPAFDFYSNYKGHTIEHLRAVLRQLTQVTSRRLFLAGDSSLDNKHWLFQGQKLRHASLTNSRFTAPACAQYTGVLQPPRSVQDVAYWLSLELEEAAGGAYGVINCAVEESTLAERDSDLLDQDKFILDNIEANDILIVSVGGNDIALRPSRKTILCMALLTRTPLWLLQLGVNPGMSHFISLFKKQTQDYIMRLTSQHRPSAILVCMIYYPDESNRRQSWANTVLSLLGYDSNPAKLQLIIERVYQKATCHIQIPGCQVIPFAMFSVLDGSQPDDYLERVEPSVQGGRKLAAAFVRSLQQASV